MSLTVLLLVLVLPGQILAQQHGAHPFVVSGVIKNSGNAGLIRMFVDYVSQKTGYPLDVVYASNYSDLSRILRENPDALGWTCGAPFVQDHKADGQKLIAVPLFRKAPLYYSVVLARKLRPEKSLSDFKGAVLAYSDPRSNSGFLAPGYALSRKGIVMKKHFRLMINTGNHEGSINAVVNGLADVAAIDEYVWVAYKKDNPLLAAKLHEVERMGPFPFTPIVAGRNVSRHLVEKFSQTLLKMNQDKKGRDILARFSLDGFVIKEPEFYRPISDMLREVGPDTGS